MQQYGIINQDNYLVIFDQEHHKQVFRCEHFDTLTEWIRQHPGKYHFIDFIITIDSNYIYE